MFIRHRKSRFSTLQSYRSIFAESVISGYIKITWLILLIGLQEYHNGVQCLHGLGLCYADTLLQGHFKIIPRSIHTQIPTISRFLNFYVSLLSSLTLDISIYCPISAEHFKSKSRVLKCKLFIPVYNITFC